MARALHLGGMFMPVGGMFMPADIGDPPCHIGQELAQGMSEAIATIDRLRMEHEVASRQKGRERQGTASVVSEGTSGCEVTLGFEMSVSFKSTTRRRCRS
jgi:hypothetical protein